MERIEFRQKPLFRTGTDGEGHIENLVNLLEFMKVYKV